MKFLFLLFSSLQTLWGTWLRKGDLIPLLLCKFREDCSNPTLHCLSHRTICILGQGPSGTSFPCGRRLPFPPAPRGRVTNRPVAGLPPWQLFGWRCRGSPGGRAALGTLRRRPAPSEPGAGSPGCAPGTARETRNSLLA
jgi:hypothetical protein